MLIYNGAGTRLQCSYHTIYQRQLIGYAEINRTLLGGLSGETQGSIQWVGYLRQSSCHDGVNIAGAVSALLSRSSPRSLLWARAPAVVMAAVTVKYLQR